MGTTVVIPELSVATSPSVHPRFQTSALCHQQLTLPRPKQLGETSNKHQTIRQHQHQRFPAPVTYTPQGLSHTVGMHHRSVLLACLYACQFEMKDLKD